MGVYAILLLLGVVTNSLDTLLPPFAALVGSKRLVVRGDVRHVAIRADASVGQRGLTAALAMHGLFSMEQKGDETYRIAFVREGLAAANRVTGVELGTAPILTLRQINTVGVNGVLAFSVIAGRVGLSAGLVLSAGRGLGAGRALGVGRALGADEASEGRGGDEEGGVKHVAAKTSDARIGPCTTERNGWKQWIGRGWLVVL